MNNSRYFSSTPPVVLNLIIINALMLLATELLPCREQNRRGRWRFSTSRVRCSIPTSW